MFGLSKKVAGSSIIESLVAIIILVVTLMIAIVVIAQTLRIDLSQNKLDAITSLNNELVDVSEKSNFINSKTDKGFYKITIEFSNARDAVIEVSYFISDKNDNIWISGKQYLQEKD